MSIGGSSYWSSNNTNERLWIEIASGIVCILSVVGSLAIILTYALVKDIRSKARELLVHISLMDIVYSSANFVGLMLPYHEHLANDTSKNSYTHKTYHQICVVQAFIAVYGTVGSVLWTLGLAVYLYYRIVSRDAAVTKRLVSALYIVCYLLPIYVTLWLLLTGSLGYAENALSGGGWCSVRDDVDPLENFMTYDIWMWLGITILIPLYLSIHIHIRAEMKLCNTTPGYHLLYGLDNPNVVRAEMKLLFVPLVFIFLRVWDVIGSIIFVYAHYPEHDYQHFYWLQFLTAIGDCGQGMFNFIIFFLFQPRLRALLIRCCRYCCCCSESSNTWTQPYSACSDDLEDTISRDTNSTCSTGSSALLRQYTHSTN